MLSDRNAREINDQIANELRTVGSFVASDEKKTAALNRIAKLQALLSPQPSREDILSELASALVEAQRSPRSPSLADALIDIAATFRR